MGGSVLGNHGRRRNRWNTLLCLLLGDLRKQLFIGPTEVSLGEGEGGVFYQAIMHAHSKKGRGFPLAKSLHPLISFSRSQVSLLFSSLVTKATLDQVIVWRLILAMGTMLIMVVLRQKGLTTMANEE
ncbi:hypothetical protein HPP92_020954 [Vanilla planifolia]|uniref:Uncharacterized protein n=1 Tax=Vanilla planifolia TaxID=51239 RepID=A0A835UGD2_VANPL|nr:hypothetical protein HPP92_020954 [Vanilla planifolia]